MPLGSDENSFADWIWPAGRSLEAPSLNLKHIAYNFGISLQ